MIVFGVIFLLLCASFISIFICKQFAISISTKYPPVDCKDVNTLYGSTMEKYAYKEYKNFYSPKDGAEPTPFSGVLKCQCEAKAEVLGKGTALIDYTVTDRNNENPIKICEEWVYDGVW